MATPRVNSRSVFIQIMMEAVLKASRSLTRDFGEVEHLQVSKKGPQGFVTSADLRSEKTLMDEFKKARPTYGFLTEETGEVPGVDKEHRWIIDPLDGTSNFIHGIPHFSVSVALEKAGAIIAAVTYDPLRDELFWAEKGGGAFLNNRRLRVSGRSSSESAMVASSSHTVPGAPHSSQWTEAIHKVESQVAGIRKLGATTLDLAYVAAGRLDAVWDRHMNPWDMAAGILLVQEAGGFVCDLSGKGDMMKTQSLLASNDSLFETFKSQLVLV